MRSSFGADAQERYDQLDGFSAKTHVAGKRWKDENQPTIERTELIWRTIVQITTREVHMQKHPQHRPSTRDTRQLLAHLIAAREQYSIYLRGVATGQRQPNTTEMVRLKAQCDETLNAWRAAHEAWRLDSSPTFPHLRKSRAN
jgi:hypothetical protein